MSKEEEDFKEEMDNFLDTKEPESVAPVEPVVEPVTEPVTEPVAPVVEPVTEPVVEPVTEPVIVPVVEPITEPVVEPVTEPVTEPIVTEPVVTEPAVTPTPTPAVVEITPREKILMERIETLTEQNLQIPAPAPAIDPDALIAPVPAPVTIDPVTNLPVPVPVAPVVPAVVPVPATDPEKVNFLGEDKLDEVLDDPEKFNAVLRRVYNQGVSDSKQAVTENVLRSIPQVVTTYVNKRTAMKDMIDDFYKANNDLVGVKRTVALVANEVAAEDTGMALEKVFEETAIRSRRILGMPARVVVVDPNAPAPVVVPAAVVTPDPNNPNPSPVTPAFAEQGARTGTPGSGLKGVEKDIMDLIT